MNGHIIVCGWGRVGRAIADQLTDAGTDVVVVDLRPGPAEDATFPTVLGDATDDRTL